MTTPPGDAACPGPALLVPMSVEALVLTEAGYLAQWSWSPPNYSALKRFERVDAPPLNTTRPRVPGVSQFQGVLLHWALPDGLTRGATRGSSVAYPAIPNRWLVTRKAPNTDRTTWAYTSWVVASDYSGSNLGSPWPNATGTGGGPPIGTVWALPQWPGEGGTGPALEPPLTAIGPTDVTWAAFAPNVGNVVSFGDPLTGVPQGPLAYSVAGWYSARRLDPMFGAEEFGADGWRTQAEWEALMSGRGWSVGTAADLDAAEKAAEAWARGHGCSQEEDDPHRRFAARTICHGMVFGVAWEGKTGRYVGGVPDPTRPEAPKPRVVAAHTSVDGVSRLLEDANRASSSTILEAFNHDALKVLEEPDWMARLALEVQRDWFGPVPGGTTWDLVAAAEDDGDRGPAQVEPGQATLLAELNLAQRALDDTQAAVESLQGELFDLWWKRGRLESSNLEKKEEWLRLVAADWPLVRDELGGQLTRFLLLRTERDAALVALTSELGRLELKAGTRPPFFAPNDPVVLITHAGRAHRHGEDGRFEDDGSLFCRFTGQTLSGIEVVPEDPRSDVSRDDVPLPDPTGLDLPPELPDLAAEAFFLDVDDAPFIAQMAARKIGGDPLAFLETIRVEQTLIWNPDAHSPLDRRTIAEASGLASMYGYGAIPSKIAVTPFAPPWSPLYLDWEIDVAPGSADPATALERWELQGDTRSPTLDDLTYVWTGPPPQRSESFTIQGRTLLTPEAGASLAARVARFVDAYAGDAALWPELGALQEALEHAQVADLLSQSLSGLGILLLGRNPTTFRVADDLYLDPPDGPEAAIASTPAPGVGKTFYFPIRGAHLFVVKLSVVDSFGQVLKVIDQTTLQAPVSAPETAVDLVPANAPGWIELKPRISQPARLELSWLSATDDLDEVGVAAGADPVCGWMVPNHLDRSVAFYDATGVFLGELGPTAEGAAWFPAPDIAPPPGTTESGVAIENVHLRRVAGGVIASRDRAAALRELLEVIDAAAWTIQPSGTWADEELPVLVGRPLAVVRGRLTLRLRGRPAYDQSWDLTGKRSTGGFGDVRFPVQIGSTELLDDGVVGFYADDGYASIYSVHAPRDGSGYVVGDRPTLALDDEGGALLTLLMDPSANVNVFSGILPPLATGLPSGTRAPLERMEVTFRTGPVMSDPGGISLPLPAVRNGAWSWLAYTDARKPATETPVGLSDPTPRLPGAPPGIAEGWLKLVLRESPTALTYSVVPSTVPVTVDPEKPSDALLTIVAYNGTGDEVLCRRITFSLPLHPGADGLVEDASTIFVTARTTGWDVAGDGTATLVVTPSTTGSSLPAGGIVRVEVGGIRVNGVPGTVSIDVTEETERTEHDRVPVTKVRARPDKPLGVADAGGGTT